jgi:Icc-related predicted phosphoesterase
LTKLTRIFYATDLHGSEICFKKFVNAAKFYDVKILILGGDLTPKAMVPIVEKTEGIYECEFMGRHVKVTSEIELNRLVNTIRDTGQIPLVVNKPQFEELLYDEKKREQVFISQLKEMLQRWLTYAEERFSGSEIRCYVTGGNDDMQEVLDCIQDSDHIIDADNKVIQINESYELVSLGCSNLTPWNTPREYSEEELKSMIERLVKNVKNMENAIFNFHVPPLKSGLDVCQKLDTTVNPPRPIFEGGQPVYMNAGSSAVLEAIKHYQPLLLLCGHIHECRRATRIGRTLCINPGSEYSEGILKGALIQLKDGKIEYQFTSG